MTRIDHHRVPQEPLLPPRWRWAAAIGFGVALGLSIALWVRHGLAISFMELVWLCIPA